MPKANAIPPENFAAYWRRVGPELERIRRVELRNFNHQKHWQTIAGLLQIACDHAIPRKTSGMVEMQRIFAKARR